MIQGEDWPCLHRWTDDFLCSNLSSAWVNVTPDGRADSVVEGRFVKPLEEKMSFKELKEKNSLETLVRKNLFKHIELELVIVLVLYQ